ncbi:MAG: hypothetical protein IPO27_02015 [Bacteroidetes bacterium]|nr:hypothetical protein [Bacteroidota bacterium]
MRATAQSATKKPKKKAYQWGNLALGFTMERLGSGGNGLNYYFDYNRALGKIYLQGGVESFSIFQSEYSVYSFHLAAGYVVRNRLFLYGMFLGPAVQSGYDIEGKFFRTIGASANMPIVVKPLEDLGIGIALYSNINSKITDNGIRIMLHISSKYDKRPAFISN